MAQVIKEAKARGDGSLENEKMRLQEARLKKEIIHVSYEDTDSSTWSFEARANL